MQPKQLKVINKMEFKDRLRLKMKEKGVTPYKIGKDTQVTRQSVDSYVKGKAMPNSEYIDILAKYLGTTTDYLLNGSENDMFVDDIIMKNEKPE
jgi:transcriptional regulator with XRE-family HTH domain